MGFVFLSIEHLGKEPLLKENMCSMYIELLKSLFLGAIVLTLVLTLSLQNRLCFLEGDITGCLPQHFSCHFMMDKCRKNEFRHHRQSFLHKYLFRLSYFLRSFDKINDFIQEVESELRVSDDV